MSRFYLVISTIDSREAAEQMALKLLEEQLAACVNIIPEVASIYKWKGAVERSGECLILMKTAEDRLQELIRRIPELHSYQVPEIIAFPIETGHSPYLDWVIAETREK